MDGMCILTEDLQFVHKESRVTDFDNSNSSTHTWSDSNVDVEIHPQTPALGGRVGQVLLDKGADANAPSVPSSQDTAKSSTPEPETDWKDEDDEVIEDQITVKPPSATVTSLIGIALPTRNEPKYTKAGRNKNNIAETTVTSAGSKKNKKNRREKEKSLDDDDLPLSTAIQIKPTPTSVNDNNNKVKRKRNKSDVTLKSAAADHVLLKNEREVLVGSKACNEVFKEFHDSAMGGHSGVNKTQNAISKRYYWPSITADIKSWIKYYDKCQRNNPLKPVVRELHPIKVSEPWEMIGIDLMGPWKETKFGFKYLFTATDFFTKWVEAFPLREKSALEVAQFLLKLFYRYGATKSVLHDNDREFVNKVNEDLCRLWGVEERFTAAYSPQTNGLDERTNQTLKRTIQKMVNDNQDDWDQFIDSTLFSIRVKIQMTTKFSPFYLMYHREAKVPTQITMPQPVIPDFPPNLKEEELKSLIEIRSEKIKNTRETTSRNISVEQEKQKAQFAKRKTKKSETIGVGMQVLKYNANKRTRKGDRLQPEYSGPYTIEDITTGKVTLRNKDTNQVLERKSSIKDLKIYHSDTKCIQTIQESTDTCTLQESTDTRTLQESTDTCTLQESTDTRTLQESTDTCTLQESTDTCTLQESTDTCTLQESTDTRTLQESTDTCTLQESTDTCTLQESTDTRTLQESTDTCTLQESTDTCTLQESTDTCTLQESTDTRTLQESTDTCTLQESTDTRTLQESTDTCTLQESTDTRTLQQSTDTCTLQQSTDTCTLQESTDTHTLQESTDTCTLQESTDTAVKDGCTPEECIVISSDENDDTEFLVSHCEDSSSPLPDIDFVQNTTDYEDNIAVIAPELSEMKKVGAFKMPIIPDVDTIWAHHFRSSWLMAVVGGHKLTGKSFEGLKPGCEISDEVINAYMALLQEQNHGVGIIDCFIVDQIINHQATSTDIMSNMAFNDFTLLLCPINTGHHWEIAFAFPQTKNIIYINPVGEQHSNTAKFIKGWSSLVNKRSMEGLDYGKGHQKWTISSVQHKLQNDSVNCGIFVMKFAELMTRSEDLFFDIGTINNIRKDMACNLLVGTSDVQDMCRKCTMHYTLNDNLVKCESCHWWLHFQCTTIQETFNEVNQEDYHFICDICSFK